VLSAFAAKSKVTFPLLSDPDLKVIKAYGLLDESNPKIAHPGMVLVEKGAVRVKLSREGYRQRPATDDLIEAAAKAK
jgi:peroxiredoxin